MKRVGTRSESSDAWEGQAALRRTAVFLRGTSRLAPRGVVRFDSFEEADAWMNRTMIAMRASRSPATSSASAGP